MSRLLALTLFALASIVAPRAASADEPSFALTMPSLARSRTLTVPWLPLSTGEPGGDGDLPEATALEPLRLSLTSTIFPVAGGYPQCATREDAAGNSEQGLPIQRFVFVRVAPRLVLHGFSIGGCSIDAGMGGGITYAVPLQPSLWLVAGAGGYRIEGRNDVLPPRTATEARVDLVKQTDRGESLRIGIERKTGTGMRGVPGMITVGGGW